MYLLNYTTEDELHEPINSYCHMYSSVESALDAIKQSVVNPDKVVLSDYSTNERKEFRWLHVEAKFGGYYKLSSLVKVNCDETLAVEDIS